MGLAATARLARRMMVAGLSVAIIVTPFTVSLTDTVPTDADVRDALITMLRQVAPKERLEQQIVSALDRDAPEEAEDYLDVADLLQVPVDPALRTRFADENSSLRAAERNIRRAAMGFVTGEGEGTVGMAAAIASDFTVVGDIRDLTEQASRIVRDEPVDDLVLGLSIAGVSMSAATVVTAGGALPIKTGISLAKLAKKTGKLTVRFQDELSWIVARAVNTSGFRQSVAGIPWYRVDDLARAARSHAARVDTREVQSVLASVAQVSKVTSPSRTLAILRHVDSVKELQDAERAAKALGKPVSGAFRLAGKRVFSAMAYIVKITAKLILALIAAILGAMSFLIGLFIKVRSAMRLWRGLRSRLSSARTKAA
ncbi:hypothetical protein [Azospirillum argentinense]|uniref:Uncharacterized protein n=1 Tax=Azospirillum argentinense TaxID=2970906 RepID=A0A5B0KKL1_9PROT|nr:hypothetical protein [Azospirillum argentinense]KAA1053197.1 hypothetical protein FH063_003116 [Azospirillum argentinense]